MMVLDKRSFVACAAAAALFLGSLAPSRAQQTPPTPPISKEAKENAALMEDWADLGTLRVLTPMKLTPAQIDKLVALISATEVEHNQKLVTLYHTALQKIAPDIRAAKKKALAGEEVPTELSSKLTKGMEEYLAAVDPKKQEEIMLGTLKTLAPKVKALLNASQIKTAAKIAQEEQEKIAKGSKGTDAQWFNYFVQRVIMGYPRIVPLLKEMKTSAATASSTGTIGEKE